MLRHCLSKIQLPFGIASKRCYSDVSSKLLDKIVEKSVPKVLVALYVTNENRRQFKLPAAKYPYTSLYDKLPLLDINLPCNTHRDNSSNNVVKEIQCPSLIQNEVVQCKHGILKIRRKKMNKHKLKKRRKRDRAQIRKVLMGREKNKRRARAKRKIKLLEKIESLQSTNPKSDYAERPYVIHRLSKW